MVRTGCCLLAFFAVRVYFEVGNRRCRSGRGESQLRPEALADRLQLKVVLCRRLMRVRSLLC